MLNIEFRSLSIYIEHRTLRANARFPANTATLPVNGELW